MRRMKLGWLMLGVAVATLSAHAAPGIQIKSPLDLPAQISPRVTQTRLTDITRTPDGAIVAVGQLGHVVVSRDGGKSWTQAAVPVSSDLVAVQFTSVQTGWAVGHDGVVLKSTDGGQSWTVKLTGRSYGEQIVAHYEALIGRGETGLQDILEQARRLREDGADKPFLDVWFENERSGWVIGAFNLILKTDDGGESWYPWLDRIDNEMQYTLFEFHGQGDALYIAGELGLLLKLDRASSRFVKLESPYPGTLFGVTGNGTDVLIHGLRGNAFVSSDGGHTWRTLATGLRGGISKAAFLSDGRLALAAVDGQVSVSSDGGASFRPLRYPNPTPVSSFIELGKDRVLLVGQAGLREIPLARD